MDQKPSVGRIVHLSYRNTTGDTDFKCVAAMITEVTAQGLAVTVFPAGKDSFPRVVAQDQWHWPERV